MILEKRHENYSGNEKVMHLDGNVSEVHSRESGYRAIFLRSGDASRLGDDFARATFIQCCFTHPPILRLKSGKIWAKGEARKWTHGKKNEFTNFRS